MLGYVPKPSFVLDVGKVFGKLAMRQISFISCLTTLALLMGGCALFGGGGENTASSPSTPTSSPATTESPTSKPFDGKPLVEGAQKPQSTPTPAQDKPSVVALTPPELITPTDPDRRRAELQKNNQPAKDPFGLLPIPPNPEAANTGNTPPTTNTQLPSRAIPTSPEVPIPQPPRLRFPYATNRTLPNVQVAPSSTLKPSTSQPQRSSPNVPPPFRGGLGSLPSRPTSSNTVARQPQPNVQISRLVSRRQTQRPAPAVRRTTTPRVAIRPAPTVTGRTVARVAQRPQTVARTTPPSRRPTSNVRIAQATPANSTPPATTPTIPVPAVPPQIPSLPAPPDPALARAVEISGVVLVGNEAQAIVKAPNEATTRYVKAGQRLSNGQVLVKRIEMGEGSEPIVILEQNGVEVSKGVGERPTTPAQPGQTAPTQQPGTPQATV